MSVRQLVSGTGGQAHVKGHAPVCEHLRPGRVSGRHGHRGSCGNRGGCAADTADRRLCCGRPACRRGSGHRDRTAAACVRPAAVVTRGNRRQSAATVGCSQRQSTRATRGGQAAAEQVADIGHRRSGERVGLLEAEVVNLQPAQLAGLPAPDRRVGDLVGPRPSLARCRGGPGLRRSVRLSGW